jgi:hypothetical protein
LILTGLCFNFWRPRLVKWILTDFVGIIFVFIDAIVVVKDAIVFPIIAVIDSKVFAHTLLTLFEEESEEKIPLAKEKYLDRLKAQEVV